VFLLAIGDTIVVNGSGFRLADAGNLPSDH